MSLTSNGGSIAWIQQWYASHCDGDWEHQNGVSITTLDNPGWLVSVDLRYASSERPTGESVIIRDGDPPSPVNGNVGGSSWLECKLVEGRFVGAGDPLRLEEILRVLQKVVSP